MSIYINILERIIFLKKIKHDQQLADYLGVSKQVLSGWRHGKKYDIDKIINICERDKLDIEYILTGKSPPASSSGPPGQYDDPEKKQMLDIIQTLARANEGLQKGLDETRAIILPKRNGTDHSAGS